MLSHFIILLLAAGIISAPVLTNNQQLENQTCFSSSHLEARKILRIYDSDVDEGVFWSRSGFLPPCYNLSHNFLQSQCLTCINSSITPQTVQVLCLKLSTNMNLIMESPEGIIHFNKTMCPLPHTPLTPETDQRGHLVLLLPAGCVLIGIIFLVLKQRLLQKDRNREFENKNNNHKI